MPGRLNQWPDWPEFTLEDVERGDDLLQYKKDIVSQYGENALRKSWLIVCKHLESITNDLATRGTSAIPVLHYDELFHLDENRKQQLKNTGCFVVRGVVSQAQATAWFGDLKKYVADNRSEITGFLPTHHLGGITDIF